MNTAQKVLADHLQQYTKEVNAAIAKLGEGETISIPFTGEQPAKRTYKKRTYWTAARRAAQSERIKDYHRRKREAEQKPW